MSEEAGQSMAKRQVSSRERFAAAASLLPGTLDIEAAISEIVEANTAPGCNFAPTLASSLHSFLVQWVTTELEGSP